MADDDEVEEIHRKSLVPAPGLTHQHFGASVPTQFSVPSVGFSTVSNYHSYEQTTSSYSFYSAGSCKRRCIQSGRVPSLDSLSVNISTFEVQVDLTNSTRALYRYGSVWNTNAIVPPEGRIENALADCNDLSAPIASDCVEEHDQTPGSSNNEALEPESFVCYGQLSKFCQVNWPLLDDDYGRISWHGDSFLLLGCQQIQAHLPERAVEILATLKDTAGAYFDFRAEPFVQLDQNLGQQYKHVRTTSDNAHVQVVIYGPEACVEDVGAWLSEIELFLQIPTSSSQDILYRNPHAMSSPHTTVTTGQLRLDAQRSTQKFSSGKDLDCQDIFKTRNYKEAQQPSLMQSTLKPHQLQALTFMRGRELGWDLHNERETDDLWRVQVDRRGRQQYHLRLSSESRYKAPLQFKGGLLADEMGLGKTCTMLSLIASGLDDTHMDQSPTLIVVPLPVLQVWEKQIELHFRPQRVVSTTYYKPNRGLQFTFDSCNIVLTTYNTVSKEWKASRRVSESPKTPLFSTSWHRIVLDEAHVIKNKDTDIAKAVSALTAECRWCMTGTPLQNRSSDIYSLLKFLRVYPYDDYRTFEATFVEPWTKCNDETALRRFQNIMATISIRRPRTTVELPERLENCCSVSLSTEERRLYEEANTSASDSINHAVEQSRNRTSGVAILNALQKINDLRYICNHGTQPRVRKPKPKIIYDDDVLIEKELQAWTGEPAELSTMCDVCGYDMVEAQEEAEYLTAQSRKRQLMSCLNCDSRLESKSPSVLSMQDSSPEHPIIAPYEPSSKIRRLVEEVLKVDKSEKCVVFSYWTSTLRSIAQAFTNSKIQFLVYDGSMSRSKRDDVLHRFTSSTLIQVILVSISCGGQGLDLTAANHAFMVEPQWNPMLEEQAMARVHRIGQVRPVKLVRMIVKGTFEENIVKLQERKRLLADLIIDCHLKKSDKLEATYKHLLQLRDLVS